MKIVVCIRQTPDGEINPLILKDFDSASVSNTTNDAQRVTVYNLNGVQVVGNGVADDVNRLQPGIYIINGAKKVVNNK